MALPSEAQTATCTLTEGALDVRLDVGERMTIMREGPNIGVRSSTGEACALVKRSEVEDLSVNGTPDRDVLVVDLEGGPILGGAEVEVGPDEIELIIDLGAGQRDRLVVRAPSGGGTLVAGAGGIALNNDRDADILLAGVEQLVLEGRDGDDRLSGAGGRGTGAAADRPLILQGGSGNDSLIGGRAADRLLGGPGRDDLAGGSGDDVLAGGSMADREAGGDGDDRFEQGRKPNGGDVLFGQAGRDTVSYAARSDPISVTIGIGADDGAVGSVETDRVGSDVEVVLGGSSSDVLIAPLMSLVGYELDGGPGADVLLGGEGDDILRGGRGTDRVLYTRSNRGVRVNLRAGVARGMGVDRLFGIQDVLGSRFADVLDGNARDNALDGWQGDDMLRGRAGSDALSGGGGNDVLLGDRGQDSLDGKGGADRLEGGPGRDTLRGDAGRDILIGGSERDLLDGGIARDRCIDDVAVRRRCERTS